MDKAQKQQGRIVLFKEEKDGVAYVRKHTCRMSVIEISYT